MYVADPGLVAFGYRVAASVAVGVAMTIVLWPFRSARKERKTLKAEQASIHSELVQQRRSTTRSSEIRLSTAV